MTGEELFEEWNKRVLGQIYKGPPGGKYSWEKVKTLPEEALAYLRGEGGSWPGYICLYWPSEYPEFLVDGLEGESGEQALRMLRAYNAMTGAPLLCYRKSDLRACKALGKSFSDVLNQFSKLDDYRTLPEDFGLGAAEYYPEEAEAYAASELASACGPAKKAGGTKKQNHNQALIYMALGFILKDPRRFRSFTETLENYFTALIYNEKKQVKNKEEFNSREIDFVFSILYKYHELSSRFTEILRDCMIQGDIADLIGMEEKTAAEDFCKKIGVPSYVYPVMVANGNARLGKADTARYMQDLFDKNPPLFAETFRKLLGCDTVARFAPVFKLAALMMKKSGGSGETAVLKEEFIRRFPELVKKYAEEMLKSLSNKQYRNQGLFLPDYLGLYEFFPFVQDELDRILKQQSAERKENKPNLLAEYLRAYFRGHAEAWLPAGDEQAAAFLLDRGALTAEDIFYVFVNTGSYQRRDIPSSMVKSLVKKYSAEAAAFNKTLFSSSAAAEGLVEWLNTAFGGEALLPAELVPHLSSKSKLVVRTAEKLLRDREGEGREALEALRPRLRGNGALAARRLIKQWDTERAFGKDFVFSGREELASYCRLNFDEESKNLIAWIPEALYTKVRYADLSGPADPSVTASLLSEYLFLEEPARLSIGDKIAQGLCRGDLEEALRGIYEFWLSKEADTKKKMILLPCCIYSSDAFILSRKKQIEDWTARSRGAIASFMVYCIALNGGSAALLMVDGYTNRAPNNQVKNTAREAFSLAARELGVTEDELSDRIVPDFGFDRRGEKILDYGGRLFHLLLENNFSLSIRDGEGKEIKSLPAPGAKDDAEKGAAAKKEFAELKKSIKAVVQNQTKRLERILMNGRKWSAAGWRDLFVKNPLMHRFALGLVWGVYAPETADPGTEKLLQSFRYMEDGSFNTAGEEEYTLPETALITLAHPIEMGDEGEAWKKQLEDYEIAQPLPQLASPVLTLGEKDLAGNLITRYQGKIVSAGKILSLSKSFDMKRGEVMDGGSYHCFFLEDNYLRIGAVLSFEYLYMGIDPGEQIPLDYLAFYRLDEDKVPGRGEELVSEDALNPAKVPPRYVSSVLAVFDRLLSE
jgi:hypothetical protein